MKKPYFHIKAICVVVFMLLQQTSFAQEVETQQETNTDVTNVTNVTEDSENTAISEQAQSDVLNAAARAAEGGSAINDSHWDFLAPTSPGSIFTTDKSFNSVDMSTGKVNVRVPIAAVGPPDLQIPIELSYTTGGIKLRDIASWVGLGWNLSCGGKITRVLNKFPDKLDGSIYPLLDSTTWTYIHDFQGKKGNFDDRSKDEDTQPDLFYFEIPGKSGMFVLDGWGNAATIPYQNVKINYDKTTKFFTITDDLGNIYSFQDMETTKVQTWNVKDRPDIGPYESTWYVSNISNVKRESVNFEYKKLYTGNRALYYYPTSYTKSMTISSNDARTDIPSSVRYDMTIDPRYLTKISWSNGCMEFISTMNRPDIKDQRAFRLDAIKLYSGDESEYKLVKSYNFEYSTFANTALKLDKITLSTAKSTTPEFFREFEYFTDQNLPEIVPFDDGNNYYYAFDHWGYYNRDERQAVGIPNFKDILQAKIERTGYDDRTPRLEYTRANSLKKIWVTSSGYNEFEYELNTRKFKFSTTTADTVGGLRIKSITTKSYELGGVSQKVRYDYSDDDRPSSGIIFNEVAYYHAAGYVDTKQHTYYVAKDFSTRSLFDLDGSHIRYGRVKELFDNGSSNTYYYTTKADYPDQGYTKIHNLYHPEEIITYDMAVKANKDFAPVNTRFWQRGLLTKKISHDAVGKETYKETYVYEMNAPIKKTITGLYPSTSNTLDLYYFIYVAPYLNYYDYISQPIYMTKKTVVGVDFPQITTDYEYDDKDGNTNDLDHVLLKKKIETSSAGEFVTTYKYPFDYISSGPQDGHVLQFMRQHNISSAPIEVVKYKNDHVIGGELYLYANWQYMYNGSITGGTYFNLREVKELLLRKPILASAFRESVYTGAPQGYRFLYDDNYVTKAAYEYNYGNKLGCVKERNKPSQSIIYDANRTLPIAQATNAEAKILSSAYHEEVLHTSFEDDKGREHSKAKTGSKVLNGSYSIYTRNLVPGVYAVSYWVSKNDGVDWELYEHEMEVIANQDRDYRIGGSFIVDELRVHKKDAQMQTRTYDLNKNVTSETDANGKTTYYEYDAFGRLTTVLDNNHNKLKSYDYYIKK